MSGAPVRDPARAVSGARRGVDVAWLVILGGVCAALHVGKLPPAITALQAALGMSLVQAGFLLSLVQLAGMSTGLAFGVMADGIGLKRSMVSGLAVLGLASAAGGLAREVPMLMLLRAVEGFGFLLVVLPAPGLVRRLVPGERLSLMLGVWGAYMPFGAAVALLVGPMCVHALGWPAWWWLLAALSLVVALWLAAALPADRTAPHPTDQAPALGAWTRLQLTLRSREPWLLAMTFACYSSQWLAVIGFLPTIYTQAGISGAATGVLTALAAAVNTLGNLASGHFLHRGVAAKRLLAIGFITMALGAALAFAPGTFLPAWLRYAAVLGFSMVGGMVPATLFALAVRSAPSPQVLSTTVGWMQQCSALGQFAGPPLVAWVASRSGGWHWTWLATGACSAAGLWLTLQIGRRAKS